MREGTKKRFTEAVKQHILPLYQSGKTARKLAQTYPALFLVD